jgi:hypothetical protein
VKTRSKGEKTKKEPAIKKARTIFIVKNQEKKRKLFEKIVRKNDRGNPLNP